MTHVFGPNHVLYLLKNIPIRLTGKLLNEYILKMIKCIAKSTHFSQAKTQVLV